MEDRVNVEIILKNKCLGYDIFDKFSNLRLISFDTIRIRQNKKTKNVNYSEVQFCEILSNLLKVEDEFVFEAYDKKNHFRILKKKINCIFSISLNPNIFINARNEIFSSINDLFIEDKAIVGHICDGVDYFWQNTEQLENYISYNKSYAHLKLIQNPYFRNDRIVDIEQNPGHSHMVNDLWFGSSWAMWFGIDYYQYIPENLIASFKDGYENVQFDNGARRVLLYEDIFSFDRPENRIIQQKFREITGMDVVAHDLMNRPPENIDPTIEILNGHFENGGTKMMKRYLNNENEMIEKSKAVKVEIREIEVIDNRWKTISIKVDNITL
ncbi:hypothetical protein [Acetivibrio clariflavus]|uniref:Uncharacterized protein n=1 Tax=Acetivibrio clariflavus (strain DSM 19732 / NBRC 101661 / EBR45) TaxID=720554 RepID=G8LSF2_ACECE|nr:hypothetical protein [Acetivibrio clariflavus]AEV68256.1 hypothetical protein Clocl_1629 [Acetivibrio clariflavus DSM 19732]